MMPHHTLQAWREAKAVSLLILKATKHHWQPWSAELFGQVRRSATSVQLNIAEGHSFGEKPNYVRHLGIAYGSAVETADLIDLLVESEAISEAVGEEMRQHSVRCRRLLVGLLKKRRPFNKPQA